MFGQPLVTYFETRNKGKQIIKYDEVYQDLIKQKKLSLWYALLHEINATLN